MIILGIETSCDETALALIETRGALECRVLGSLIHSQAQLHSAYGGVFPALAKREHGKNLVPLLKQLLAETGKFTINDGNRTLISDNSIEKEKFATTLESFSEDLKAQNPDLYGSFKGADFLRQIPHIDRIAVTEGPGLEPALWVGINFAKILSAIWNIPVVPINHMEGHIVGSLLPADLNVSETSSPSKPSSQSESSKWHRLQALPLPSIAFLISGGHTELVKINRDNELAQRDSPAKAFHYEILGSTKDDAVGEAFDKVARLLELPYPGGPQISKLAQEAREKNILAPVKLPRPMIKSGDCNFSFSGLKTAVLYSLRKADKDANFKAGLAREFEDAVADTLEAKLRFALELISNDIATQSLIIGGGVSANKVLRQRFENVAREYDLPIFLPSQHLSGDNALMIALAADYHPENLVASTGKALKAHGTKRL